MNHLQLLFHAGMMGGRLSGSLIPTLLVGSEMNDPLKTPTFRLRFEAKPGSGVIFSCRRDEFRWEFGSAFIDLRSIEKEGNLVLEIAGPGYYCGIPHWLGLPGTAGRPAPLLEPVRFECATDKYDALLKRFCAKLLETANRAADTERQQEEQELVDGA